MAPTEKKSDAKPKAKGAAPAPPLDVLIAPEQEAIPVVLDTESLKGAAELLGEKNGKGGHEKPVSTVAKSEGLTASPTTTEEEDLVTKGQRHINRLWEYSQAIIAVGVTSVTIFVMASAALSERQVSSNQLLLIGMLNVMTTLILTSYFTRTNHDRQGGVGKKPTEQTYTGR